MGGLGQTSVAILCGGRGTRLQEETRSIPKPLVEIGGRPILWHVMQIYLCQGFRSFVLCLGYKGELIERFVSGCQWPEGVDIQCVDTGIDTGTGGRIKRAADHLPDRAFHLTYADGLADIDLAELSAHHAGREAVTTMTVVRPDLPFGVGDIGDDGRVRGFHEKPRSEHWINGGFFVCEPAMLDYLDRDGALERQPLERLAHDERLYAFHHQGFWACMDTYKDALMLNDLWTSARAPWRVWEPASDARTVEAPAGA